VCNDHQRRCLVAYHRTRWLLLGIKKRWSCPLKAATAYVNCVPIESSSFKTTQSASAKQRPTYVEQPPRPPTKKSAMDPTCEECIKVRPLSYPNCIHKPHSPRSSGNYPQRPTTGQRRKDSRPKYLRDRQPHQPAGHHSNLLRRLRSAAAQQQTHR
jgi:hypothetical protein